MKIKCGGIEPSKGLEWINIDKYPHKYTDKIVDLDKFPYYFDDNSVEAIDCENVLDHTLYPLDVLKEFHRILKVGGKLRIQMPFYNHPKAQNDITRFHSSSCSSIEHTLDFYLKDKYKIVYKKIWYSRFALIHWKWLGNLIPNYITFIEWRLRKI